MATNVSDVYLGFWVDQSEENVLLKGKMTISSEVAKFLTAFFVMYVTFAASKLWDVVAYLIHFARQGKVSERGRPQQCWLFLVCSRSTTGPTSPLSLMPMKTFLTSRPALPGNYSYERRGSVRLP